jgi:hypothetical protein
MDAPLLLDGVRARQKLLTYVWEQTSEKKSGVSLRRLSCGHMPNRER